MVKEERGGDIEMIFNIKKQKKEVITMPGGDRTGPAGMGPRTGRSAGFCAGYSNPGYANTFGGRGFFGFGRRIGFGRNMGRGRGFWRWPANYSNVPDYSAVLPEEETQFLKDQIKTLEEQMKITKERLNEIRKEQKIIDK